MYNDSIEYIKYIKENGHINLEPIHNLNANDFSVLNENLNFNQICEDFYKNGYVIFDNFLKEEYATRLKEFVYNTNIRNDYYFDYAAINLSKKEPFHGHIWFPLLSSIVSEISSNFSLFKKYEFVRGWAFIHENFQTRSVSPHLDGLPLTMNFWVTPEQCIETCSDEYNGIVITDAKSLRQFESEKNYKKINVPYKFNRAMIFNGNNVHYSLKSRFKDGYKNKKVNFTFLFKNKV